MRNVTPLILDIIAATLLVYVAYLILDCHSITQFGSFLLLLSLIFFALLPTLFINLAFLKLMKEPALPVIMILVLCLLIWRSKISSHRWDELRLLLIIYIATAALHILFATVGWFYQY